MQAMKKESEINMYQTENLSYKSYRKQGHPRDARGQGWEETDIADTLNIYDLSEARTPILIVQEVKHRDDNRKSPGRQQIQDCKR